MKKVMIIEDEQSVRRSIEFALRKEGYETAGTDTLQEADSMLERFQPELILCDLNLPDGNGLEFIRRIRKKTRAYLICLTALDQEADMVMGYEAGADDYIVKPFSLSVLILKINALSRKEWQERGAVIQSDNIRVDQHAMKVFVDGRETAMTKNEWKLLLLFLENPNMILSREQILERIFDSDSEFVDDNTVAVNIARLRKKLGNATDGEQHIKNVRGLGYVWNRSCKKI